MCTCEILDILQGFIQDFLLGGGGGVFCRSQKQFIYIIIWSSHDRETVKQISDENLTNYIIVRCHL